MSIEEYLNAAYIGTDSTHRRYAIKGPKIFVTIESDEDIVTREYILKEVIKVAKSNIKFDKQRIKYA